MSEASEAIDGVLSRLFATQARARILDFFLDHKEFDYPVSEIAQKAGLSFRTVLREIPKLERTGLIIQSRKVSNAAMYRIETNLSAVALLDKLSLELSRMPAFTDIGYKVDHNDTIDDMTEGNTETVSNPVVERSTD